MGKDCNHAGDCSKILFAKTTVIIGGSIDDKDGEHYVDRAEFIYDATRLCGGLTFVPTKGTWLDKKGNIITDFGEAFTAYVENIEIAQRFTTYAAIYAKVCGQETVLISTENTFAAVVDVSEATLTDGMFDPPIA